MIVLFKLYFTIKNFLQFSIKKRLGVAHWAACHIPFQFDSIYNCVILSVQLIEVKDDEKINVNYILYIYYVLYIILYSKHN